MTREEQLQAAAQEETVVNHRKVYEHNINQLVEKLKQEIVGAMEYENFLIYINPYYADKAVCRRNHKDLDDIYIAVENLPLVYFEYSHGRYGVDLEKEGH